jgi:carboxylesterase 2/para-nitrobenzyl esterase
VRDALTFGPKPPQGPYPPFVADLLPELTGPGEDCLTLNIWSKEPGRANQPVMVWIPGGMFEYHGTGACPWYDGSAFARDGIVCVTINYRVGAEGFLYLADGIANLGLLDQIAALEWVRENIAVFGGNPANVTVFGESAGALSIGTLLSVPRADGLFHRAIVQSGGSHHVSSPDTALRIGRRLAERMGVEPTREAIAAAPIERMLAAQIGLREELAARPDPALWGEVMLTNLPWQPVIDGDVVPSRPIDRILAGAGRNIDLLVGSNTEETRLFLVPSGAIDQIPLPALAGMVAGYGLAAEPALAAYRELHPGAGVGDLFSAIQTDWYWRIPAMRLANAHAHDTGAAGTFMYEFAWRSPQFGGRLGAGHSLEIAFVFDALGRQTIASHGDSPPQPLAAAMHNAWVAFATTGDPGWPRYEHDRMTTMRFDVVPAVVEAPLARQSAIWNGVR